MAPEELNPQVQSASAAAVAPRPGGHAPAIAPQPGHIGVGTYLRVAAILTVITAVEFGVVYVPSLAGIVKPLLLVLSSLKFAMVVLYFMHLKNDSRVLAGFFASGMALTIITVLAVLGAMMQFYARS